MADGFLGASYSLNNKRIWVAGHRGMVGGALVRRLESEQCEILTCDFDLRRQAKVEDWLAVNKPDVIVIAAAKVGGILANRDQPAEFLYDNLMIEANIIHAAAQVGVEKLLFLGSSCIYPKNAAQPIREEALLTGPLEETNEAYSVAKIAGVKLCQAYRKQHGCDFISVMPCNLYGPSDRFDEHALHVIPALMMKMDERKDGGEPFQVWGSGRPLREFLYVEDLAEALVFLLQNYSGEAPVNVGSGEEISIADLAHMMAAVTGYQHDITFDPSKPDGVMRKILDSSRIRDAGWAPKTDLRSGLEQTYRWYKGQEHVRAAA